MKIAYFDCYAGAGGDMIAASLIDAGLEREFLVGQLRTLDIGEFDIRIEAVERSSIAAVSFKPAAPKEKPHRNLDDILELISSSGISDKAKKDAAGIFRILAEAEAAVHGKNVEEVHFHEVGAFDSIIDIAAAAVGFDALGIEKVVCSPFSVGGGTVKIAHGDVPVPAPATVEILKRGKAAISGGPVDAEILTPTAAAVLTYYADEYGPVPAMSIDAIGYGAGTMEFDSLANVLRVIIGRNADVGNAETDSVCLLEANVDDVSGEVIGYVTEKLMGYGALDVYTTAIQMKKNRPGVKISVITSPQSVFEMEKILFGEGITFGIRKQVLARTVLTRDFEEVETAFGKIKIKSSRADDEIVIAKPEFSDCVKAAKSHGAAVREVQRAAMEAFAKKGRNGDN